MKQRAENERNEQRDAVRTEQREFELKMLKEQAVTFITFLKSKCFELNSAYANRLK
jgi:hypothetical protein